MENLIYFLNRPKAFDLLPRLDHDDSECNSWVLMKKVHILETDSYECLKFLGQPFPFNLSILINTEPNFYVFAGIEAMLEQQNLLWDLFNILKLVYHKSFCTLNFFFFESRIK